MRMLTLAFAAVVFVGVNYAEAGTLTTIDAPGAIETWLWDISGNNIIGRSWSPTSGYQTFLYNQGTWTTLDIPGVSLVGIDGSNIIGGSDAPIGQSQGVLYNLSTTSLTTLNYPGAVTTGLYGISGNNIVGGYQNASDQDPSDYFWYYHGCFYNGTTWAAVNMPGALYTWPNGIDGNNIVGEYYDASYQGHGFLATIVNGVMANYTTLDIPGAKLTDLLDISGNNIIGYYKDADATNHAFLYNGGLLTDLDYPVEPKTGIDPNNPGATFKTKTFLRGIDGDKIVGYGVDSDSVHGFVYTIPEPTMLSLLALGGLAMLGRRQSRGHKPGPWGHWGQIPK